MIALRKKIHNIIDEFPDQSLEALEPLLLKRLEEDEDYWKPEIERITCSEEIAMIDERMRDYEKDPASFAPLDCAMDKTAQAAWDEIVLAIPRIAGESSSNYTRRLMKEFERRK